MRTTAPTHPIAPAVTDRHIRWPQSNEDDHAIADTPDRDDVGSPPPVPAAEISLAPSPFLSRVDDAPLPPVGDFWGVNARDHPIPVQVGSPVVPVSYPRTSMLANAAMIGGLASIPLVLLLGVGGILGILAVVAGAVSIHQLRRQPGRPGTARAITGIVAGTGSALVGVPILAVVLAVSGAL